MVVHAFNPSTQEVEAGKSQSLSLRPASSIQGYKEKPCFKQTNNTPSQRRRKKEKEKNPLFEDIFIFITQSSQHMNWDISCSTGVTLRGTLILTPGLLADAQDLTQSKEMFNCFLVSIRFIWFLWWFE